MAVDLASTSMTTAAFEEAEAVIEQSLESAGVALVAIRDGRGYLHAGYTEFDLYCRERWHMSEAHATRQIQAARVIAALPIGNGPSNEAQARELVPLLRTEGPAAVAEVWQEAVETAPNGRVTAAHVESVVERHMTREEVTTVELRRIEPFATGVDRTREATRARRERIAEMAREGYREESIAEAVGIGTDTVRSIMHDCGIPTLSSKIGRLRTIDANKVMDGIIESVTPPEAAIGALDWRELDRTRFEEWDQRLMAAIRILADLRKGLKKASS